MQIAILRVYRGLYFSALFFLRNYRSGIERMLEHLLREESDEEGEEIIES